MPAVDPAPSAQPARPRRELVGALRRIDGWGPRAWREIMGVWQLASARLACEEREGDGLDDPDLVNLVLALDQHGLGGTEADSVATADWLLREIWARLLPTAAVRATTARPAEVVRATNACWTVGAGLRLRLLVRLPFAGMCCDGRRLLRFVRQLETFAQELQRATPRPGLTRHRRTVAIQRSLRAALPGLGLVAFLGAGARLARGRDGGPARGCRPLRPPPGASITIDLGRLGRFPGLGLRRGLTVVAGAPYHGKSTLLAALASGREDHPPHDGRELVVAAADAVQVLAEDGRRIKRQDLRAFFRQLPGGKSGDFSTERASGATSMAASLLQGLAGGSRLLLIDEDSAASNFLAVDPLMRRLLGRSLAGTTSLIEALPELACRGLSTVLVAGASSAGLALADQVLLMEHFQPRDISRQAHRLATAGSGRQPRRGWNQGALAAATPTLLLCERQFADQPDCLLGPRHFLPVLAEECERPRLAGVALDLRRCGWPLDPELARGACAAAAWACRLARPGMGYGELERRFAAFIAERGVAGLDPFHTQLMSLPPWPLVVAVLERLERPWLTSGASLAGEPPAGRTRRSVRS